MFRMTAIKGSPYKFARIELSDVKKCILGLIDEINQIARKKSLNENSLLDQISNSLKNFTEEIPSRSIDIYSQKDPLEHEGTLSGLKPNTQFLVSLLAAESIAFRAAQENAKNSKEMYKTASVLVELFNAKASSLDKETAEIWAEIADTIEEIFQSRSKNLKM